MDPISVVSTAISIVKFIVEWKKEYGAANESVRTLGATIDVVHAALISLDPIRHPQLVTPLQALVECLNETKNILVAHTTKATKSKKIKKIVFPSSVTNRMNELEGTIIKLVSIMNLAVSAQTLSVTTNYNDATLGSPHSQRGNSPNYNHQNNQNPPPYNPNYNNNTNNNFFNNNNNNNYNNYNPNNNFNNNNNFHYNNFPTPSVTDVFVHEETKRFWNDCFGPSASTTWDGLERALNVRYVGFVNPVLLASLRMQIDNLQTGFVSCHRLSEFCGPIALSERLRGLSVGGFQSGLWTGYYDYKNGVREPTMFDVTMVSCLVSGSGADVAGPFVIKGAYDSNALTINWQKTYTGKHTVFYKGKLDSTNTIKGTWEIGQQYMGGTFVLQLSKTK